MRSILVIAVLFILVLSISCAKQQCDISSKTLIDGFESEIVTIGDDATVEFGSGGGSTIDLEVEHSIVKEGNSSLKMKYNAVSGGWMWVARGYGLTVEKAADWVIPYDRIEWKSYDGFGFYLYGDKSGSFIAFDIIDQDYEYFRFLIDNNFKNWKWIECNFDQFMSRSDWQPDKAKVNGEIDFPVRAYQFEPRPEAKGVIYIDEVSLVNK